MSATTVAPARGAPRGGGAAPVPPKDGECIHSGHFMVSQFEADAQDDEEAPPPQRSVSLRQSTLAIDTNLNNLFQCMTLAYRQKLTSPKWNRFKGVKLRWKEKIRLNNVIWRCWHMQFIMKQNNPVCQFASPLDVDTHTKPETTLLEGKYWKRRAEAVTAEYQKWRMYYRNRVLGCMKDFSDILPDMDILDWQSHADNTHMLVDEDYIAFMSDTLFSTISNNQPFAFPDTREIARGANLADFIQPSLGPLQPNLEDFMDTLEPLQDFFSTAKLPPVPEESIAADDSVYRNTFSDAMMDPNLQNTLNMPPFPLTPMTSQHLNLPQQPQRMSNSDNMLQSLNRQIMPQESRNSGLRILPSDLENQQAPPHSSIMMPTQNQNLNYMQANSNSQININSSVIAQNQSQTMMLQPYNIMNPGLIPQNVSNQMLPQQPIISNSQEIQKNSQYIQGQKMYHQIPVTNHHDRNYVPSGHHQSRADLSYNSGTSRRASGNVGYIRERMSRQRPSPFVSSSSSTFNQYNSSSALINPQPNLVEKSHGERPHDQNLITSSNNIPQNINLTAGIFLSNIGQPDQNLSGVSGGNQNIARFKMPSPPPQLNSSALIPIAKVPSNNAANQQLITKNESFRSNSLPIGATIGTVVGNARPRRRPRSGSSSPAPPRRTPLNSAASEPSLKPASVLLAQLLTSKSQEIYKPNSMQSLTDTSSSMNQQIQPVAILPSPTSALIIPKIAPPSPQFSGFNASSPNSATSPQSPLSPLDGSGSGKEHRRAGHIHAEQKRRYNIKNGFDLLQSLIPQLSQNPNPKVSKAAMLQKGAEYIKQLQSEQNQIKEEIETLKKKIEYLNNSISNFQSLLPATGAPVSRQRSGKLKEMFDDYVCQRTNENWKFWIFSLLIEPLLSSFNNFVSQASTEELKRSTLLWAEQHCSLVELRPAVLNSLRNLCSTTDILDTPQKLPDVARSAVNKKKSKDP